MLRTIKMRKREGKRERERERERKRVFVEIKKDPYNIIWNNKVQCSVYVPSIFVNVGVCAHQR